VSFNGDGLEVKGLKSHMTKISQYHVTEKVKQVIAMIYKDKSLRNIQYIKLIGSILISFWFSKWVYFPTTNAN